MPRGWLLLLCAFLAVWVPTNFAAELATTLPSIGYRGAAAIVELLVHGVVAALAMAAAWALLIAHPDGERFAMFAVVAATATAIQDLFWSALPSQTKPGDEWPIAAAYLLNGTFWLGYLRRRARSSQ
jgi:hypothetical protein